MEELYLVVLKKSLKIEFDQFWYFANFAKFIEHLLYKKQYRRQMLMDECRQVFFMKFRFEFQKKVIRN